MKNQWTLHPGCEIETSHGTFAVGPARAGWTGTPAEFDAAVRLAASAPELLDALRACRSALIRCQIELGGPFGRFRGAFDYAATEAAATAAIEAAIPRV